jgi:hypothetical protein
MPAPQSSLGPLLVGVGLLLVVGGLIAWVGGFAWFGRLPGDLRWERGSVRVYAPLASMLLLSLVATVVVRLGRRFLP